MMTAFYELPPPILNEISFAVNNEIPSATGANKAPYDYYYCDTNTVPTQLLPMNIFEPYYTCCHFIFGGSLGEHTGLLACVAMISNTVP